MIRNNDSYGILLSYYIRYEVLNKLVYVDFTEDKRKFFNTVHVFIDVSEMVQNVLAVDKELYRNGSMLTSAIINIAAHYRGYFRSRHNCHTKIWLIHSETSQYDNVKDSRSIEYINQQLEMVKILCAYINDVYYIRTNELFYVAAYSMMRYTRICVPTYVVAKNKLAYQLVCFNNNTAILRPKKYMGEDRSYRVQYDNVYDECFNTIDSIQTKERLRSLNPMLLSLVLCISSAVNYTKAAVRTITTVKAIQSAIAENKILDGYNSDLQRVYSALSGILAGKMSVGEFIAKFQSFDLMYLYSQYINKPSSLDETWNINYHDPLTVKNINDKYFVEYPLDILNF